MWIIWLFKIESQKDHGPFGYGIIKQIPEQWDMYSFKINFRDRILKVTVTQDGATFNIDQGEPLEIMVNNEPVNLS